MNSKRLGRGIGALLLLTIILGSIHLNFITGERFDAPLDDAARLIQLDELERSLISGVAAACLSLLVSLAFFRLLRPVSSRLALTALGLRLVDTVGHLVTVGLSLRMLDELAVTESVVDWPTLAALQVQRIDVFHIALVLVSAGMAIVVGLLGRGRLIPLILAGYGVAASVVVVICVSGMEVFPALGDYVYPWFTYANGVAYVSLTLWLLCFSVSDQVPVASQRSHT